MDRQLGGETINKARTALGSLSLDVLLTSPSYSGLPLTRSLLLYPGNISLVVLFAQPIFLTKPALEKLFLISAKGKEQFEIFFFGVYHCLTLFLT